MSSVEVAVPFHDNWYFDAVCAGIERRATAAGVEVRVFAEAPGAAGRALVTDRFDAALGRAGCVGAIAVGFEFRGPQIARLAAHGRPLVVVGGTCPGLPSVALDDVGVGRAATEHLLALGHVSIAHVAGYAISPDDFTMRSDRVRGYSDAMRDAGLDAHSRVVPCAFDHDAAYRTARELLSAPDRPTAVFAVADELAFAVLDAARDLGLHVPADLSVVGVDDHPDAEARGLTTWRQDPVALGDAAARRVLDAAAADEPPVRLTPVERTSASRPGRAAPRAGRAGLLDRLLRRSR